MRGYSLIAGSLFLLTTVSPRQITNIQRLYLSPDKITADRTSPAFSAMEDAFIIEELVDRGASAETKKINLKGIKLSLNKRPIKFEKINLRGERIGVAHFTDKFILKKKSLRLVSVVQPEIHQPIQAMTQTRTRVVEGVTITSEAVRSLSSAGGQVASANFGGRIELPSGVTLTRPDVKLAQRVSRPSWVASSVPQKAPIYTPNKISGKIILKGQAVLSGEGFYYYINRSLDGKIYESGALDAASDDFEMETGSLKGRLSVELRSEKGEVLAYGEQNLDLLGLNFQNLKIEIYPSEELFTGRVLDAEKSLNGKEKVLIEASKSVDGIAGELEVDEEGYFNESLFDRGSSFIVETKSKNYWSDLNFGVAGKPLYPRLIKKDMFENFAKTLDPFGEEIEIRSAIVGSVSQKGLAQRDVEVRLFNSEYQKPVYFAANGSANPKLIKTTVNGGFIFVNIPNGGYLVQAVRNSKILAQKWYIVREGRISQGQINIKTNPALIASAESFPRGRDEEFILSEFGMNNLVGLSSTEESEVLTKTNSELLVLEVEKSEKHIDHIYITPSKIRKKRFRVINKNWMRKFLNNRRSNANRALGFVVGFIRQNDFKVIKETTTALSSESQIFYFDKYGSSVSTGRVGGGFIITDVPPGLKSVVVHIKGRDTFSNRLIISKPYTISIF